MDSKRKYKKKGRSVLSKLGSLVRESISQDKDTPLANFGLTVNLATVAMGFLFACSHTVFGAYPLGIALVSVLPRGVWLALLGAVLGSLSLGKAGVIYALICLLAVFLRVIISGTDGKDSDVKLFSESVSLRVCAALISASVASLYEILLNGIDMSSILFSAATVFLSGGMTALLSGAFYQRIGIRELVFSSKRIFDAPSNEGGRYV